MEGSFEDGLPVEATFVQAGKFARDHPQSSWRLLRSILRQAHLTPEKFIELL
jgi:hypothetical protein